MEASVLELFTLPNAFILPANIKTRYHHGSFKYERAATCRVSGHLWRIQDENQAWVRLKAELWGSSPAELGGVLIIYAQVTQSHRFPQNRPVRFCVAGANFHSRKLEWVKVNFS